jgi:hypothetical protein
MTPHTHRPGVIICIADCNRKYSLNGAWSTVILCGDSFTDIISSVKGKVKVKVVSLSTL